MHFDSVLTRGRKRKIKYNRYQTTSVSVHCALCRDVSFSVLRLVRPHRMHIVQICGFLLPTDVAWSVCLLETDRQLVGGVA